MMNINIVTLCGQLGKDPTLRRTANGNEVANASLATSTGKDDAKQTTWHNVVAWGSMAAALGAAGKGDAVYVSGRLQNRKYTDRDGNERWITEVVAEALHVLNKKEQPRKPSAPVDDDIPF